MRKAKLYRRWRRRLRSSLVAIQKLLAQSARAATPETVHDLRVTLRRARIFALVGAPVLGKSDAVQFRQWALKVAVALGEVRDFDAMLEWIKTNGSLATEEKGLVRERARAWRRARPKVLALSRPKWDHLRHWKCSAIRPGKLRERFLKVRTKVQDSLKEDAARFHELDPAGLHEFRRELRRLRYLHELTLSRREQQSDRALEQLVAFQEALGELQNCAVVRDFYSAPSRSRSSAALRRLAEARERQWLQRAKKHLALFARAHRK